MEQKEIFDRHIKEVLDEIQNLSRQIDYNSSTYYLNSTKDKSIHEEGTKTLTPKQMHQRLSIALAKVKSRNTSENSLNEVRKIICSLY